MPYDDRHISPFLISQPNGDNYQAQQYWRGDAAIEIAALDPDIMKKVRTLEEAEDHYLSGFLYHKYHTPTAAILNTHVRMHSTSHRRGSTWISLMHPDMFESIRFFPPRNNHGGPISQFTDMGDHRVIGRWSLAAVDQQTNLHVWTSPHLARNTIFTVYRSPDSANDRDGIVVVECEDGYALSRTDDPYTTISDYVSCAVFDTIDSV